MGATPVEPQPPEALEAGLAHVLAAPADRGVVELVVARPAPGARAVLDEGHLDPSEGLVGDGWRTRGSRHTADGSASEVMQVTLMNARVAALVARTRAAVDTTSAACTRAS